MREGVATTRLPFAHFGPQPGHNDLPDQVVETLLRSAKKNAGIFQRYFRLKAGWLGLDKLTRYDIYAPLAESDKKIRFWPGQGNGAASYQGFLPEDGKISWPGSLTKTTSIRRPVLRQNAAAPSAMAHPRPHPVGNWMNL